MSSITCKATKAKISKERAAKARNALEKQHREIATQQKQQDSAAPFIFLDKRDDEVKAAMDAFQSDFEQSELISLSWGEAMVFRQLSSPTTSKPFPSLYLGLLALSDDCDLPDGQTAEQGQGYWWDGRVAVEWKCEGYHIGFSFPREHKVASE
ncbi:hypothetical protein LTR56_027323 [Elasticomyces elasticus]|nr:hypothetical protein LTR56_027323 [Elasticomyces elasticus]KAK4898297.1 hypothetical protein LTR49_027854 [Elasticomyces elasticus]KAK5732633.1 hypothetical protein LTS12_027088 [Elasticomyces elasticus]